METVADFYAGPPETRQQFKRFRLADRLSWDGCAASVEAAWAQDADYRWNYIHTFAQGSFFVGPIPIGAVFPFVGGAA